MKGIILAGGKGTRLYPLTKIVNKHILPVGNEPMIYNPIKQLLSVGIKEILIITSREHMGDLINLLGSGEEFGCSFTYKVQEEPRGIADALLLGENFTGDDSIVVILGDNIATHSIKPYVDKYKTEGVGAKVLLKKVETPQHFGIAALDERKILCIQEKPDRPKSDYAVIGIYMYDKSVFDIIRDISYSERGELEITTVNNVFIDNDNLSYDILHGRWTDAGTLESYKSANDILYEIKNEIVIGE